MRELQKMCTTTLHRLALVIFGLHLAACAAPQIPLDTRTQGPQSQFENLEEYIIQPGDELDLKFYYSPELDERVQVRPDGRISLQLVDDVRAAGLSASQLDETLTRKYAIDLKAPQIAVIVRSFSSQRVYVAGEVNRQGLVNMRPGMTALEAVIEAGGWLETAKPEAALIIRRNPHNQPVPLRVDLKQGIKGEPDGIPSPLQPYDIVYVPKTYIAQANKFVNQYVQRLLLFQGWGLGFTYELRDFGFLQ